MPTYQSGGAFLPGADYLFTGDIVAPAQRSQVVTLPADGAIQILAGVVRLTKGSAAAMTLAAPSAAQDGMTLIITAGSAFAHVVTATALIQDGVTGGAKTTLTFAAFVGATITLVAVVAAGAASGTWYVASKNLVTIT